MWKQRLAMATTPTITASPGEQIKMFVAAGYRGIMTYELKKTSRRKMHAGA